MIKPTLIKTWAELAQFPDSATHTIEIDPSWGATGFIFRLDDGKVEYYLSSHTFYGTNYQYSTKILQECGFNVVIGNWDKEQEE